MEATLLNESLRKPLANKADKLYYCSDNRQQMLMQGNCLEVMGRLPAESVDVIFADPPYFLSNGGITCQSGKMVKVDKGKWDKSMGADANHEFNKEWLRACQRVLAPNGTIFVSGTQHVIFSVGFAMQQLGFKMLNDISWFKVTPPPNLSCRYFTHSTETIIWAARDMNAKHYFDYQLMKQENGGKQMKSLWHIKPPYKSEKRFGRHPTQKPVGLLARIIRASSRPGDLVLDPFNGSGTTGVVAALLKRAYIGIELDDQYLELSAKRLRDPAGDLEALRRS